MRSFRAFVQTRGTRWELLVFCCNGFLSCSPGKHKCVSYNLTEQDLLQPENTHRAFGEASSVPCTCQKLDINQPQCQHRANSEPAHLPAHLQWWACLSAQHIFFSLSKFNIWLILITLNDIGVLFLWPIIRLPKSNFPLVAPNSLQRLIWPWEEESFSKAIWQ